MVCGIKVLIVNSSGTGFPGSYPFHGHHGVPRIWQCTSIYPPVTWCLVLMGPGQLIAAGILATMEGARGIRSWRWYV